MTAKDTLRSATRENEEIYNAAFALLLESQDDAKKGLLEQSQKKSKQASDLFYGLKPHLSFINLDRVPY